MGINPYKGEMFALLLPDMSGDSFKVYIEEFQKHIKSQEQQSHALILDGARNHRQSAITMTNLDMIKLPAYCPELNPVERFFKEIRRELANKVFEDIKEVEKRLIIILRKYYDNPLIVQKLTLFAYLKKNDMKLSFLY
jgi:transposase